MMESNPCEKLLEQVQAARQALDEASRRAKAEVVTQPLEPDNLPPALEGTRQNEPYEQEKEARKRLEELEKAYQDCLKGSPRS